jgi:type I restriction enzyme S subunit
MLKDWIEVELGDVCDVVSGKNQKNVENPNGKYPIYGSGGIFGYADDYLCEAGTTVIGRKGTINSPIYVNQKFWNVDTAFGISPLNNIDSKYIHYLCVGFDFKKLDKSTTIPSLAKRDIVKIKFPLAPLSEQRAIATKIEQLFSELDNGIANLKTAKSKLEIYRQAILKQAFEGGLTKDWRKKQPKNHGNHVNQKNHSTDNLPETWKWVKLEDLAIVGTGATPKRGDSNYWLNGSIAWITSGALNDLYVKEASEFITEAAIKETNCKIFPKGSLLIAMYGEGKTRGKCSELMISAATNQAIASIEINDKFKEYKKYIKWFLLKNYDDIRMLSSGGVQPNLNLTIVKNTKLPFCPIEEQTQIVQEIETRLSVCDKLNEAIEQSLEKAQALRQSILKKAFEGKLLSQDELQTCRQQPDWETAAKLLERVKNKKNK